MNYNIEKLDNGQVKITSKIAGDDWNKSLDESFEKNKGKYVIEGFRKGKAPRAFVEKKYGRECFIEDAVDICLQKVYTEVLSADNTIEPIARPDVDVGVITLEECNFTITVQCPPKVIVGAYKGLKVTKAVTAVTDEMVNAQIAKAQEQQASFTENLEGEVKNGDTINLDYSGSVDGVVFAGGTAEKQELNIGSGTFIPGFEEQLVGVKVGEEKDVKVTFPTEYQEATLAGKEATFKCKVNFIKVKNVPEVNDEFAKDISEFATLAEYKADIKAKLDINEQKKAEINAENELVEQIVAASNVEAPESMIESQTEDSINEFAYKLKSQGLKIEDYFKFTNSTVEDLKKQYHDNSKKSVMTKLVLDEIIKAEGIKADEAALKIVCVELAKQFGKKDDEIEEFIKTMPENYKQFAEQQAVSDALIKFLKDNNQII